VTGRVLLVEDEEGLRTSICDLLAAEGLEVDTAADGVSGGEMARAGSYSVIVLDVMLPGKSGMDVCRDLRREGVATPILMLTARSQVVDKVLGLKLGADDYLTKPFDNLELLARIEALSRRGVPFVAADSGVYAFGDVRVDFRSAEVRRGGEPVELSAMEYRLLRYFIRHRGALLSRDVLLDEVWGYHATPYTRTVDQHVSSLRRKIEPDPGHPQFIVTQHRLGYKFLG